MASKIIYGLSIVVLISERVAQRFVLTALSGRGLCSRIVAVVLNASLNLYQYIRLGPHGGYKGIHPTT